MRKTEFVCSRNRETKIRSRSGRHGPARTIPLAPVVSDLATVRHQKSCERTGRSPVKEQAEILCKNRQKSCARTDRSPVQEQACRLCVVSSVKEILGMLELSAAG
ncbi:hypothetical protein E3N88_05924 [Mikania micrantha]|uniref:Uncharacterized protein n=1 Tax=Mikania micrantha TaxID=192012 RepID=A0A5N6PMD4_9ASTR|nr:hypothetical protein E3N88_05924 [Mikania micrantha]